MKICLAKDCSGTAIKRSMCQKHYRRWWRNKEPEKNKLNQKRSSDKKKALNGHWSNKAITCKVCKIESIKTGPNQIYCSKKCQSSYHFKKSMQNVQVKLRHNLRARLRKTLHGKARGLSPVRHLGCSVEELKKYLEAKFTEHMTWNNYGEWHMDHIKPLASFNLQDTEEFIKACHYTNLQPLWAKDNLSKGASYER